MSSMNLDMNERTPNTAFARIRYASGKTCKEIADAAGLHIDMIFRYQRGELVPRRATRVFIADLLGVTEFDLWPDLEKVS